MQRPFLIIRPDKKAITLAISLRMNKKNKKKIKSIGPQLAVWRSDGVGTLLRTFTAFYLHVKWLTKTYVKS